jgi:MFS family permease
MATLTRAAPAERTLSIGGLLVLSLGALDFGLEQSIILPALPELAAHYDASLTSASWLVTGFLLASVVSVPVFGRLGDLYGKRLMLLVALGAFALGSLICALTDYIGIAIAGRAIQGMGAAVAPLTYALVRDSFPPSFVPRAVGIVVGAASAGSAIGYLLSGILVDGFSAVAIFWFLFVLPLVLGTLVIVLVPETSVRARVPLDPAGAVLLAIGLFMLLLAISKGRDWGWTSELTLGLFAAAFATLVVFAFVERRVRAPMVDLALVARRPFLNTNVCAFAFGFSFFITAFVIPALAATPEASGYGSGLSTMELGLILFPTGVTAMISALVAGRVMDRIGPRAVVAVGSLLSFAGYLFLVFAHSTPLALAVGSATVGLAWGLVITGVSAVVVRSASTDKTGVAVSVMVVIRNTAASVGAQVSFALVTGAGVVAGFAAESGYTRAFALGAVGALVTLATASFMPGRQPDPASAHA